jgi:putative transposase
MPWNEKTRMDEKRKFIEAFMSGAYEMSELCRGAGISRPTGYLWIERYRQYGWAGLEERSHATHGCAHRTPADQEQVLLELRAKHPHWGARKLLKLATERWPGRHWPGRSTVAELLRREGLVQQRRRRVVPRDAPGECARTPAEPNALWTIDFKGEFRTGDHRKCYPLTVADLACRYLLTCHGQLAPQGAPVTARTERLFCEYGLPATIHSDGGAPFAGPGIGRLSRVSLRWLKLGIRLERSRRGCPQDNASHERMHRTLKQETARPPAANLRAQQRRFDRFVYEFNHVRPHEALGDRRPAELYRPSNRPYPSRLPQVVYPGHYEERRVTHTGEFKWRSRALFLSSVFAGELIGLEEIEDGVWSVYFGKHMLARLDEHVGILIEVPMCKGSPQTDL